MLVVTQRHHIKISSFSDRWLDYVRQKFPTCQEVRAVLKPDATLVLELEKYLVMRPPRPGAPQKKRKKPYPHESVQS